MAREQWADPHIEFLHECKMQTFCTAYALVLRKGMGEGAQEPESIGIGSRLNIGVGVPVCRGIRKQRIPPAENLA